MILLVVTSLLLLPQARGFSYSPGVMVGDWARYSVSGRSFMMMGMQNAGSMEVRVQGISGSNLSMIMTTTSGGMMGSQTSHTGWFDMASGVGSLDMIDIMESMNDDMGMGINMTMMSIGMMDSDMENMSSFMAGGLTSGSPIFQGAQVMMNQTMNRNYLQMSREVNELQIIKMYNGHTFNMTGFWDQPTGLMTEYTVNQTSSTQAVSLQLTSTSLWGSLSVYPGGVLLLTAFLAVAVMVSWRRHLPSHIR